ncbi:amino acid permease/ SLC12A domain-containing protein [Dactylonectria macrodidyma]|uniref:Amino acid permease/ SLC12A domain-containing protein n=1 Tax=Dactylonectria macrodidyma TaxID=307937 RepID=A0A9P9E455_9HYPO|nr:amino acid permease/ SLC12A domain-containing protein [Dactylonectria macrodidyma]
MLDRIIVFYIFSMFIVGFLVPSNDPTLGNSTGTAQKSPFVIAFQKAGIRTLPSIINGVLVSSAFSCGAAVVFLVSRVLYGLAEEGQAPKVFLRTNRLGTPYVAVTTSVVFLPLVYLSLGSNSSVAFGWFVNIATIAALISWFIIEVTYLRFFYAMKVQGVSRERLPYKSPLQPYMAWITMVILAIIVLFKAIASSSLAIGIPIHSSYLIWASQSSFLSLVLWAGAFIFLCNPIIPLNEIDLSEMQIIEREREEEEQEEKLPWYRVLG